MRLMAVSWRPDQLDPPRPVSARAVPTNRHQAVQSSRRRKGTRCRAASSRGAAREDWGTMAHATKCVAPEGNRGRDEWMTVIEMQEYMGGRAGARRTTSSGRERSTRTGSEGSSWFRGRLWMPTSSRGAGGNDGGDRPGSRPRPGTRESLETKGAQARPRDGVTAPLSQVRTDKGKLRVAFASQLRRSILVFRNLEEAANLFHRRHQQPHPAPPCTHRQRML